MLHKQNRQNPLLTNEYQNCPTNCNRNQATQQFIYGSSLTLHFQFERILLKKYETNEELCLIMHQTEITLHSQNIRNRNNTQPHGTAERRTEMQDET